MNGTDITVGDWLGAKASGVLFATLPWEGVSQGPAVKAKANVRKWRFRVMPVGDDEISYRMTDVFFPTETEGFAPRTALGRKLMSLRKTAVASGMRLLTEDEVIEEVKWRRGELEGHEADLR